jgi:hypothetical protein
MSEYEEGLKLLEEKFGNGKDNTMDFMNKTVMENGGVF